MHLNSELYTFLARPFGFFVLLDLEPIVNFVSLVPHHIYESFTAL